MSLLGVWKPGKGSGTCVTTKGRGTKGSRPVKQRACSELRNSPVLSTPRVEPGQEGKHFEREISKQRCSLIGGIVNRTTTPHARAPLV